MSIEEITRMHQLENLKFETAKAIRQLLDEVNEKHETLAGEDWEEFESEISALVFEE